MRSGFSSGSENGKMPRINIFGFNDTGHGMGKFGLQESRWLFLMVGILLLTTLYGAYRLNDDSMWVDEVISMQRSGLAHYVEGTSPADVWQRTALISDQVPAYYTLLALWGNIVGTTPFALRILSLLSGVVSVAIIYQIGKNLLDNMAGIGAAVALSSSAFYMLFLHDMRTYTLLVCLIALLIWCYWLLINGRVNIWSQAGLVLATSAMMYSYYLSIVIIASICLYHLIFVTKNREWWRVVILMGVAGLLFLPWLLTSFSVFDDSVRNAMRTIHTTEFIPAIVRFAGAFSNQNIVLMLLLMLFALRLNQQWSRFVWFLGISCLALMIALNEPFGVFVNLRYNLVIWIPLALLTGTGIACIVRSGVPAVIVCGVLIASGLVSNFNEALEDRYDLPIRYLPWDSLIEALQPYKADGDVMTFITLIEGDDWEGVHEERVMPHYFHDSVIEPIFVEDVRNLPDADFLRDARVAAESADRIWLSYDPTLRSWRTGLFEDELRANGFDLCANFVDSPELYLDLYAHPRAMDDKPGLQFGEADSTARASFAALQDELVIVSGGQLRLLHGWQLTDDFPRHQYSLAVHIFDAEGNPVTQADYGLPSETFDCVQTLVPTDSFASGTYQIRVFVYQWQDRTRLPLITSDALTETDDGYITIAEFVVE